MSQTSPVGLATTYLFLFPLSSGNCTVYSYLPFCARTYSQAAIQGVISFCQGCSEVRRAQLD